MKQRVHDGGSGKNWLFFGDQSSKTEFYYKDEIESWLDEGHMYRFTTAWSRDQEEKIYVQHRLKEHGAEVWEWFERGAYFYICGDKQYMAKDVTGHSLKLQWNTVECPRQMPPTSSRKQQ